MPFVKNLYLFALDPWALDTTLIVVQYVKISEFYVYYMYLYAILLSRSGSDHSSHGLLNYMARYVA